MSKLRADLDRWVEGGLITPEQADAIESAESIPDDGVEAELLGNTQKSSAGPFPWQQPRFSYAIEVAGYLGVSIVLTALVVLCVTSWGDLNEIAHLVLLGVVTFVSLICGVGIGFGHVRIEGHEDVLRRLGSFLWAISTASFAGSIGVLVVEVLDISNKFEPTAIFVPTLIYSSVLWWFNRKALLQLTGLAASLAASEIALFSIGGDSIDPVWFALAVYSTGIGWCLFTWANQLHPESFSWLLGAAALFAGAQFFATWSWNASLVVGGVTSVALVACGLLLKRSELNIAAGFGALIFGPQIAFRCFDTAIPAVGLLLIGLFVIGAAATVARFRNLAQ